MALEADNKEYSRPKLVEVSISDDASKSVIKVGLEVFKDIDTRKSPTQFDASVIEMVTIPDLSEDDFNTLFELLYKYIKKNNIFILFKKFSTNNIWYIIKLYIETFR